VIFPWLLRPALLISGASNDFSGSDLVISSKVEIVICRRDGDVGLKLLTGIAVSLLI
jgi:hypothetical protein